MFIKSPSNQNYSLGIECVEKYITKPNPKIFIKKIKKQWNSSGGDFLLPEELLITAKIKEEYIDFSKFAEIRDYLKFIINQLETRIERYIYLIQGITMVLGIDLLINLLVNNPRLLTGTTILGISLIAIAIVAISKIFSSHYLLFQYRLMQAYFDQESVEKWLEN